MKNNRGFHFSHRLSGLASVNCAQTSDKKAATHSALTGPEFRWKYETGIR